MRARPRSAFAPESPTNPAFVVDEAGLFFVDDESGPMVVKLFADPDFLAMGALERGGVRDDLRGTVGIRHRVLANRTISALGSKVLFFRESDSLFEAPKDGIGKTRPKVIRTDPKDVYGTLAEATHPRLMKPSRRRRP